MNKKGTEMIVDLFVVFITILVVVVFWAMASFMSDNISHKNAEVSSLDSVDTELLLWLNQQLKYKGKIYSVAESIPIAKYDEALFSELKETTEDYFYKKYDTMWKIRVLDDNKEVFSFGNADKNKRLSDLNKNRWITESYLSNGYEPEFSKQIKSVSDPDYESAFPDTNVWNKAIEFTSEGQQYKINFEYLVRYS